MLHEVEVLEARRIAEIANAARRARDQALSPVAAAELDAQEPARGIHHPEGQLGLDLVPDAKASGEVLRRAIDQVPIAIRRTLWSVMRVGRGDYAAQDWAMAMEAGERESAESISREMAEEIELHDLLMKGLFELRALGAAG